jgi:hypothetical protein
MDDEDWTEEENPNDALRFHVIAIDSNVQTRSPYNRNAKIWRREKYEAYVSCSNYRRTWTEGAEGRP